MADIHLVSEEEHPAFGSKQNRRSAIAFAIAIMIIAFVMGIIGSLFGLAVLTSSPLGSQIKAFIGIKEDSGLTINRSSTERLILEESSAIIDTTKKVAPSVVSITTSREVTDFFGQTFEQTGGGTGFIVTSDGLIVTNRHVVDDERMQYTVITADGNKYEAKILAKDTLSDLAILEIETTGLPVVEFGDSDSMEVGQWVVAIGNALAQFDNTVTVGVVSAKNREITASSVGGRTESLVDLIQTDAAINPGNSGGPLVNLKGQVVGINTAVAGNAQNIGFAIPINQIKNVVDFGTIRDTGKIVRPYIGVRYIPITPEVARASDLDVDYGVYIFSNNPLTPAIVVGSPAEKAGLKQGDILLEIDGVRISQGRSLNNILSKYRPEQSVEIKYRRDGEDKTINLTLGSN